MEPKMTWRNIEDEGVEMTNLSKVCRKYHIAARSRAENGLAKIQILASDSQYETILAELK